MASYLYRLGRRLALVLWVFCHEALMYFGLLPYPHEVAPRSRIRPPGGPGPCTSPDNPRPNPSPNGQAADRAVQPRFQDP
jgi:hypothetical protein